MDARRRRSQESLFRAVLARASALPLIEVTVTDVAADAGVNRSTFYQHAATVPQLLRDALRSQLDEARAEHLQGLTPEEVPAALEGVTRSVLRHIDANALIYQRAFDGAPGEPAAGDAAGLAVMLTDHFATSAAEVLAHGGVATPGGPDTAGAAARYIAAGTVGAIQAWLRTPGERDVDAFAEVITLLHPAWWTGR